MSTIDDGDRKGKSDQGDGPDSWILDFNRGANGKILSNAHNLELIIQHDNFFENLYHFNDMTRSPEVKTQNGFRKLEDSNLVDAHIYCQKFWLPTIKYEIIKEVVFRDCERRRRHPVRDYLNSLQWDGEKRLTDWLINYVGAEATVYNCKIGRLFFISAVARIMEPGCKCDYVVVLEGKQGIGKSTVWRTLFTEYFSDDLSNLDSKDSKVHVSRFWCIEISEMHTLTRGDAAHQKQFITRQIESFRPVYRTLEVDYPRQCVIVGTINEEQYLKDETGGRRYWPVKCGFIDIAALARDRDQLFAEAVCAYRAGEDWWPDREFELEIIAPEQEARRDIDAMTLMIGEHVNSPTSYVIETTIPVLWRLLFPTADPTCPKPQQIRIANGLKHWGFHSKHTKKGSVWLRPKKTI